MILARAHDFDSWRVAARILLRDGVEPDAVAWSDGTQGALFGSAMRVEDPSVDGGPDKTIRIPARFVTAARIASESSAADRFDVLYRLAWKITRESADVLDDPVDPHVSRLRTMTREVREEEHDMHAFVRFRPTKVTSEDGTTAEHWVAWYRPKHSVLDRVAPFFARRYPNMRWSLFTPERSAHWDGKALSFGAGAPRDTAPRPDELDSLFFSYYGSIFNPARTNPSAMGRHMPARVRQQVPETSTVPALVRQASSRVATMRATRTSAAEVLLPASRDIESLATAAAACRACPIGERATQTVFGAGPRDARLVVVGEQPGDEEDRQGKPFVGPAGRLLDELMQRVGFPRDQVYVTNAVKHFKWEPRGKRRLHAKPSTEEVSACRGWLLAEIEAIKPAMILCLGATAAQSFCGPGFRITRDRGKPQSLPWASWWMATFHPSALLRAATDDSRQTMESAMLGDLALARDELLAVSSR